MTKNRGTRDSQTKFYYNKGKEDGIRIGIRYWEMNRAVHQIINRAAREKDITGKMGILSDSEGYMPHLYDVIQNNPKSKELERQQKSLEDTAQGHGFVMTEKGIYLTNKG